MPPKRRRSPRTLKSQSASRHSGRTSPASEFPEVLAREDDEDDIEPEGDASGAESSHASALALSKIREALKGLLQEDLQSLVKGTSAARPLQVDDRAAATAALDLTVKEYLYDILDDSTCKLYSTVALDPLNAEDGVWNRILSGIRPSVPEMLPDISVYAHNELLDWRPKKVTPDTTAAFLFRTKEAVTDDVLLKLQEKPLAKL